MFSSFLWQAAYDRLILDIQCLQDATTTLKIYIQEELSKSHREILNPSVASNEFPPRSAQNPLVALSKSLYPRKLHARIKDEFQGSPCTTGSLFPSPRDISAERSERSSPCEVFLRGVHFEREEIPRRAASRRVAKRIMKERKKARRRWCEISVASGTRTKIDPSRRKTETRLRR